MRRWIQEKHLRDKNTNTNTIRRHRHRSLGDVETSSKNKRHLPPHSVQVIKLSITYISFFTILKIILKYV